MDMSPSALANNKHLSQVAFGLHMTLETIFVPALLLTDLAVPSEPLEPFGFHGIGEVFRSADFSALPLLKSGQVVSANSQKLIYTEHLTMAVMDLDRNTRSGVGSSR
jgi:hypothetical protein